MGQENLKGNEKLVINLKSFKLYQIKHLIHSKREEEQYDPLSYVRKLLSADGISKKCNDEMFLGKFLFVLKNLTQWY